MAQHFVCLTFDVDNASSVIARGPQPTLAGVSRGEFGVVGTERILRLLAKHDIRATWFIPGHSIESYPASVATIAEARHEIGHHGWTHRRPTMLSREEEARELVRGNEAIKALTGRHARGYRAPAGEISEHTVQLLLDQGFVYDTSLMADDHLPYQARSGDVVTLEDPIRHGRETELIEFPISFNLDDHVVFEFTFYSTGIAPGLMNATDVLENWVNDFIYMAETTDWGILTYTCHPHVIGRGHRMIMLDRLIDRLKAAGATFLTMDEATAEYRARYPGGRRMVL